MAAAGIGAMLGGCNGLFGIEDATLTPDDNGQGGAGGVQAGAGGAGGAIGGRAGQGGGGPGGSGGAPGGSGGAPGEPFDAGFGTEGVVVMALGALPGSKVTVFELGHQRGKVFLAIETEAPKGEAGAAPAPDKSDLVFARFVDTGAPDPTFGGFLATPGRVLIDPVDNLEDRFNAVFVDPNAESTVFTHFTVTPNSEGGLNETSVNAKLLADGSSDTGFFPRTYVTSHLEEGSSEVLFPHDPGTGPGHLVVRCNEFIDFQQFAVFRFEPAGTLDANVTNEIPQMPTRISCSTRPVRSPDGADLCIALASRDQSTPESARLGTACLRTASTNAIANDAKYGNAGTFLFTPPALDPVPAQFTVKVYALAFDAQGRIYEAFRAGSHTFIARLLADGTNVDASFGAAGLVDLGGGAEVSPFCLAVDAAGSVLWGETADGVSSVRRFASDGSPSASFGPNGRVELPGTFTPQRCAIDPADRLVVAGPTTVTPAGEPAITLLRLRNN